MMKKDWLKDIHDRMADFDTDAPQGLWDDICAAESKLAVTAPAGHHKNKYLIWIGSAVAVAACMLLIWVVGPDQMLEHTSPESSVGQQIASTEPVVPVGNGLEQSLPVREQMKPRPVNEKQDAIPAQNQQEVTPACGQQDITPVHDTQQAMPVRADRQEPTPSRQQSQQSECPYLAHTTHRRAIDHSLAIGLSASGGIGSDHSQLFRGDCIGGPASMLSESEWVDRPMLGIMALNRGAETERTVRHSTPVRAALSLSYRLNDRWSIESGLSYAFLSSEISEGSVANYVKEEQRLHYVGVPLGVTYRLFTWRRLDLYLSSNILAEQCVSGQSRKKYVVGDRMQGSQEVSAIQSRPLQLSVGAKAGVQYNFSSMLSLYFEPGCNYYLDDRSSLETAFRDNPLDFTMNLGLRFTVGR